MRLSISKKRIYLPVAAGLFMVSILLYMVFEEAWSAIHAWFLVTAFMLPLVFLASSTKLFSVRLFIFIGFVTQFITVPFYYLFPESYSFHNEKPFAFDGDEILYIFPYVSIFLLLVILFSKWLRERIGSNEYYRHRSGIRGQRLVVNHAEAVEGPSKQAWKYKLALLLLTGLLIPYSMVLFNYGIGITGVEPPRLPYRLSGIMIHLKNMVFPLVVGYLYIMGGRRSYLAFVLMCLYGLILGVSSASKGVVLLVMAPVIVFALIDNKRLMVMVGAVVASFGVFFAAATRNFTYVLDGTRLSADTTQGIVEILGQLLLTSELDFRHLLMFVQIAARVESFQSIILGSQFNPDAIGGSLAVLKQALSHSFVVWDHDAYHIEWQGSTVTEGANNVGSILAMMLMASNGTVFMVPVFAAMVAIVLTTMELRLEVVARKYNLHFYVARGALFYLTFLYFTAPGYRLFNYPFLAILVISVLPAIRVLKVRSRGSQRTPVARASV